MFLSKRKPFLQDMDPGVSLEHKSYTYCAATEHRYSSSFAHHHTWQAGLSQMGVKTDMTLFLASTVPFCTNCDITILLLSIKYLLPVDTGLPQTNTISLQSAVVPRGLSPYSSVPHCGTHRSPQLTIPCLFRSAQKSPQTNTNYPPPLLWYPQVSHTTSW